MTQIRFDTPRFRSINWAAIEPAVPPRYRRGRSLAAGLREASSVVALLALLAVLATIPTLIGIAGMAMLQHLFG